MPPNKKQELTHDEIMRVGIKDIDKLVEGRANEETLIKEAQKLWDKLFPRFNTHCRQCLTAREKAFIAVRDTQAKYWREKFEERERLIAKFGLTECLENAEFQLNRTVILKNVRLAIREIRHERNCNRRGRNKSRKNHNRGHYGIFPLYNWLNHVHIVPKLREALEISDEGFRKACRTLYISQKRSQTAKIGPSTVTLNSALKLLSWQLGRNLKGQAHSAQAIWDDYAFYEMATPGYQKLKSILVAHGANCDLRPLVMPQDTLDALIRHTGLRI